MLKLHAPSLKGYTETDESLLYTIQNAEEESAKEALLTFFARYSGRFVSIIKSKRIPEQDIESLKHEVFLSMMEAFTKDRWKDVRTPKAWLATICANCCRDYWRAKAREDRATEFSILNSMNNQPDDSREAEAIALGRCVIKKLPNHLKQVAKYCYIEGWTAKQIAQHLKTPEGTVASRLDTIRKRLKKEWIKSDYGEL